MADISNRALVLLLAVALIVTAVGTAISVTRISQLGNQVFDVITGAPSYSFGESNITVTSITSLSLAGGNGTVINFGTGFVNASCDFCTLETNGLYTSGYSNGSNISGQSGQQQNNCCTTFNIPGTGFLIENTGNINLSVGYTCSGNCTYAQFLGGDRTNPFGSTAALRNYSGLDIKITPNSIAQQPGEEGTLDSSASCAGGDSHPYMSNGWNITNSSSNNATGTCATPSGLPTGAGGWLCTGTPAQTYVALSSRGHYLCGNATVYPLAPDASKDAAVLDFNITILSTSTGAGAGGRSSFRITFNGTSAG